MVRFSALLLAACLIASVPAHAKEAASAPAPAKKNAVHHRVDQLTGKMWQQSSKDAKLGFLLGVETAIAANYMSKHPASGKELDMTKLSPFEKVWYTTFKDTAPVEIMHKIDAWFAAHPDKLDRHVMKVLWHDLMHQPVTAQSNSAKGK